MSRSILFAIFAALLFQLIFFLFPPAVEAHPSSSIVVDRLGRVYFSDLATIWRVDSDGKLTAVLKGRHTHNFMMDAAGNLIGEEIQYDSATGQWTSRVWKLASDGRLTDLVPPATNTPGFYSSVFDDAGNMYFTDSDARAKKASRILRRSSAGEISVIAGGIWGHADGQGSGAKFGPLGGMALGPDGVLYVMDGADLRRVTLAGEVRTVARGLQSAKPVDPQARSFFGIAVATHGKVLVSYFGDGRVLEVAPDGNVRTVNRSERPWQPTAVAVSAGRLYVLEYTYRAADRAHLNRVKVVFSNGTSKILAQVETKS